MILVSWSDTVGETWSQETIMAGKKKNDSLFDISPIAQPYETE